MHVISPSLESFKANSSVTIEWHTVYIESSLRNNRIKDRALAWPAAFPVGLALEEHWAAGVQFGSPSFVVVVTTDLLVSLPLAPCCAPHLLYSLGLSEHPLQGVSTGFVDPGKSMCLFFSGSSTTASRNINCRLAFHLCSCSICMWPLYKESPLSLNAKF